MNFAAVHFTSSLLDIGFYFTDHRVDMVFYKNKVSFSIWKTEQNIFLDNR